MTPPPSRRPTADDAAAGAIAPPRSAGRLREYWLPGTALLFIVVGSALRLAQGPEGWGERIWTGGLIITGVPVVWQTARGVLRGRFAADLVAMLAVVTAVLLQHPLAGLIVVLMQTGGEALERYAGGRASRAVRDLEAAAPRRAHRRQGDHLEEIAAEEIRVGDLVLILPGEMAPCDGVVEEGHSHVDTARLTGEPVPIRAEPGTTLMSGSLNGEGPLVLRATRPADESQYARIVELVRSAQASKSSIQRLADRYAVWFTPLTLLVCAGVYLLTGDTVRILAVLVVATPCPLILATPVAIIGGINRAARRHIIVRSGGALEQLATISVAVFDKTGTLTIGLPRVSALFVVPPFSKTELLRLAAAIERGSSHLLGRTVVQAADVAGIELPSAVGVVETPGRGIRGVVAGQQVAVGARSFVLEQAPGAAAGFAQLEERGDGLRAYVLVDGEAGGVIEYEDYIRPGLEGFFQDLVDLGIVHTVLLSGDHSQRAQHVGTVLGIDEIMGDLLPEDKVRVVRRLVDAGEKVVMVGDGTNDAPALSTATVGIALAGHGRGGITTEAAEIVLLVDDLGRVTEAIRISKRTIRIARQSIWAGLALSGIAMVFAALGMIPPTVGALLQEGIDIAVIVNALRASTSSVYRGL